MKVILDMCRYQSVDWNTLDTSKIDGIMLKTVSTNYKEFGGLYIDPRFESWYAECKKRNIPVGAYYYTYALDKAYAEKELALFKKAIMGKTFELPLAVDVEDNSLKPLSTESLTDLVEYAMDTIQSWGAYAVVYTYTSYEKAELDVTRLKAKYDWWVANYTRGDNPNNAPESCGMWQFTSDYVIKGILTDGKQRVDASYRYKDYPSIIKGKFNDFTEGVCLKPISAEPIKLCIGKASSGDIKTICDLLDKLKVEYMQTDGFIYTVECDAPTQSKIMQLCKDFTVPIKQYQPIIFPAIEEETCDTDANNELLSKIYDLLVKIAKFLKLI